jgi:hypothetical protein
MAIDSFGICQQYTDFVDGPMFESSLEVAGIPELCGVTIKVLELGITLTP